MKPSSPELMIDRAIRGYDICQPFSPISDSYLSSVLLGSGLLTLLVAAADLIVYMKLVGILTPMRHQLILILLRLMFRKEAECM